VNDSLIKSDQPLSLSVVVPLYNEVESVERLWDALYPVLQDLHKPYEVILVDDGSRDGTREKLRDLAARYKMLRVILFRANFGQSAAMAAGFEATRGEIVIAMDGDLQNDPRDIPMLLDKMAEGYDVVSGWRKNRKDKLILRKVPSKIANRLICSITDVRLHDTGCSLKAFRGNILRRISLYGELHRFIPALTRMEGALITELPVRHHARQFGQSKYNLSRTFRVIMDLTTIRLLMRHLRNPLSFFVKFSSGCMLASLACMTAGLYKIVFQGLPLSEVNILITLVILLSATSLQFLFLGLIGRMIVENGSRRTFYQQSSTTQLSSHDDKQS
jgi:glycosyltransferase involved in cell wall biosynthesis